MPRKVIVRDLARQELKNSVVLYESRRTGQGRELYEAVLRILREIAVQPSKYPKVTRRTRCAVMIKLKFEIDFHLDSDGDIVVTGFSHHTRRSGSWMARR